LKCKNKHALIRKFNPTSKKHYHPTFVKYKKKSHQFIFSLPYKKIREKKKNQREKIKIKNIWRPSRTQ
jgi:hypothetical protein